MRRLSTDSLALAFALALAATAVGCGPPATPSGMRSAAEPELDVGTDSLTREPSGDRRPLMVVFPRSACSGSASAIVVDEQGRFLGAVPPGTASLLSVPSGTTSLMLFSSVELTAPVGTWHGARRVAVPSSSDGLVLESWRWTARDCGNGADFEVRNAKKSVIDETLTTSDIEWLVPVPEEGQGWLDAHRRRVVELLTTPPSRPPGDITHILVR